MPVKFDFALNYCFNFKMNGLDWYLHFYSLNVNICFVINHLWVLIKNAIIMIVKVFVRVCVCTFSLLF